MISLETLRVIGIKKIIAKTHISKSFLDALLNEEFNKIQPLQLKGFIDILEREYKIDFTDVKEAYKSYAEENGINQQPQKIFIEGPKESNYIKFIMSIILVALMAIVYFKQDLLFDTKAPKSDINITTLEQSETIEKAKNVIEQNNSDFNNNETIDLKTKTFIDDSYTNENKIEDIDNIEANKSDINMLLSESIIIDEDDEFNIEESIEKEISNENIIKEENNTSNQVIISNSLIVKPKKRLWFGVINLTTNKKQHWTQLDSKELDINNEYLILCGHGNLKIEAPKNNIDSETMNRLYIHYKDGKVEEIDKESYKKLNGGKIW